MSEKLAPRTASHSTDEVAPLSPYRAFVVQFRTTAGQTPRHFAGRVEHMTSGQAVRFSSSEELVAAWEKGTKASTRAVFTGSNWLLEPEGYVLIAACGANEYANEVVFEGSEKNGDKAQSR